MVRAAAYARYSDDMQREESIEAQLKYIYEYASQKGISITKEYIDRGLTGKFAEDRKAFMQMIEDAQNKNFEIVLVHKSNRFARNREESAIYKHRLKKQGVKVIAVGQDFGEGTHTIIMEALMEGLDEYYSVELANETMKGLMINAEKCKYNGGHVLFGYKVNENNIYELEPKEAATVREVFDKFIQGFSYGEIQRYLSENGKTNRRGVGFSRSSIYEMLRNEKYRGVYIFNESPRRLNNGKRNSRMKNPRKDIVKIEGGMPAIVSPEMWQQAQDLLNNRVTANPSKPRKKSYLLTGFIKCGNCGGAYTGYATKKGYYTCTRKKNKKDCDNKNIPQEQIEHNVISLIQKTISGIDIDLLVKHLNEYYMKNYEKVEEETENLSSEISTIKKKINNLVDAIAEGKSSDAIKNRLEEYENKKERLEARLSHIRRPKPSIDKAQITHAIDSLKPENKNTDGVRYILRTLGAVIIADYEGYDIMFGYDGEYNVDVGSPTPTLYSLITEILLEKVLNKETLVTY